MKDKPISGTFKIILLIVLGSVQKLIDKVENEFISPLLKNLHGGLKRTVDVLSDADPNNEEQLKKLGGQLIYESAKDYNQLLKDKYVANIDDVSVQQGVNFALDKSTSIIKILTDDDPNNKEQLKEFIEEHDVESVLLARDLILSKIEGKDDVAFQTAAEILKTLPWEEIVDPS